MSGSLVHQEKEVFNTLVTNGLFHPYHLDVSTFIFRGNRSNWTFSFHFSMKITLANIIAPEGTPHFAASHLGLFCLPMSHKRTPGLYRINRIALFMALQFFQREYEAVSKF